MSLEDIKGKLLLNKSKEIDVLELRLKIQRLEKDVTDILTKCIEEDDKLNIKHIKKNISHESLSLIQTLLLLLN